MTEPDAGDKPALIATGGPLDGSEFALVPGRDTALGSSMTAHVRIELSNVDAEHARVSLGSNGLRLFDLGSGSGTYVNGEKIDQDHLLHDGDRICLGPPGSKNSAKLLVRLPPQWAPPDEDLVLVPPKPEMGLEPVPERPVAPPPPPPPPPAEAFIPPPPPPLAEAAQVHAPPPPPPPPPSTEARKKPDYVDELPSILGSQRTGREDAALPPPPAAKEEKAPRKKVHKGRKRHPLPVLPVLIGLGIAGLAYGGYWAANNLFKAVPVVQALVPVKVEPGRSISINGSGFESDATRNTVRFADQVGAVTAATPTQITVTVPMALASGTVPVLVETRSGKSNPANLTVFRPPQVTGVQPDVAMPGETVVITGSNLDGQPRSVNIGGLPAEVKEADAGTMRAVVPDVPVIEGRKIAIAVQIGSESAKPAELVLGRLPMVLEAVPPQGAAGDRVVLKGRGFDANAKSNLVTFGGEPAVVLAATPTDLTVAVPNGPPGETQSKVPVVVKANGAASSGQSTFVVTRLSATVFVPHFFIAPVPDDPQGELVFVATDLGPTLVLGGKGGALSTAERAVQAVEALNAAFKQASGPPQFEFRAEPQPAVAVAGVATPILTATPEDAAAYGRPWDGGKAAARRAASPKFVAQYWTALLQDYAGLFVAHQRPIKVLELSPRGKVLADLYAEAARSAGPEGGVPSRLLSPLSPAVAKGFREMALLLPAEGQGRAGATIEGRWDGTLDEGGATRDVQVRFKYEGARLTGSLSSRRGSLDMNTPLKDVVLDKGAIRFAVDLSGTALTFKGTVQGDQMTGTAARSGAPVATAGSFSLKFVE